MLVDNYLLAMSIDIFCFGYPIFTYSKLSGASLWNGAMSQLIYGTWHDYLVLQKYLVCFVAMWVLKIFVCILQMHLFWPFLLSCCRVTAAIFSFSSTLFSSLLQQWLLLRSTAISLHSQENPYFILIDIKLRNGKGGCRLVVFWHKVSCKLKKLTFSIMSCKLKKLTFSITVWYPSDVYFRLSKLIGWSVSLLAWSMPYMKSLFHIG